MRDIHFVLVCPGISPGVLATLGIRHFKRPPASGAALYSKVSRSHDLMTRRNPRFSRPRKFLTDLLMATSWTTLTSGTNLYCSSSKRRALTLAAPRCRYCHVTVCSEHPNSLESDLSGSQSPAQPRASCLHYCSVQVPPSLPTLPGPASSELQTIVTVQSIGTQLAGPRPRLRRLLQ
jgi:hypothetical protein